jgi:hypothetical protein
MTTITTRRAAPELLKTYGIGIALVAGLGTLALTGRSTYEPTDVGTSAYARPTPALDGQSLAAYIAAHEVTRLGR